MVRIALLSPYSWTYPGGVTRHIEALHGELLQAGHEAVIMAPVDPDDELSRRMHRGARPHVRATPDGFVPLGRTIGIPANGAVSNLSASPAAVAAMRRELARGAFDVVHLHEPVVPLLAWEALTSTRGPALVGTFHTYSENALTNGIAAVPLGGRLRMNRLHARIAVSQAAEWTARRFYGGRYTIIPNGVHIPDGATVAGARREGPMQILCIGQAVERKGLPVLLRAFEALRDQIDCTLTLVGPSPDEVAHMMHDDHGVLALGKVTEERKLQELARADVVCAPSLGGESFGMVLTEAFAAGTTVVASDIPGYRDVVRDGVDGLLVPPGDALALAETLRALALDEDRRVEMAREARKASGRFAWPRVAAQVLGCYEQALAVGEPESPRQARLVRHGLAPADLLPKIPAQRLPSLRASGDSAQAGRGKAPRLVRRAAFLLSCAAALVLALLALNRIGVGRVATSLLASQPGLVAAALGVMCVSMFARAIAWHAILASAPTWRKAKRRDAMQGTFIGVLMSSTLPARLGEPSRAIIVSRRIGRARETLPIVLGTMVSQTILNLVALSLLGIAMFSSVHLLDGHHGALLLAALAPIAAIAAVLLAPVLVPRAAVSRSARLQSILLGLRHTLARVRDGLQVFRRPRAAAVASAAQLGAWGLQLISCWLLLLAFGLGGQVGIGAAAAVLFAVNVTAVLPATPANVGVFQAACVAVLAGGFHVSTPDAIAYGIVLQAVEVATALVMGMPALVGEGLSWRDVRLRTMQSAPVELGPLPEKAPRRGLPVQGRH